MLFAAKNRHRGVQMAIFSLKIIGTGTRTCRVLASSNGRGADSEDKEVPSELGEAAANLKKEITQSANTRRAPHFIDDEVDSDVEQPPQESPVTRDAHRVHWQLPERADLKLAKQLGSSLFKFVFDDKIEPFFRKCDETARERGEALSVKLCMEYKPLAGMPWEVMYDRETNSYLSTSQHTQLSRCINAPDLQIPRGRCLPIAIAGMIAVPQRFFDFMLDPIGAKAEMDELQKSLKDKANFWWTPTGCQLDLEHLLLQRKAWDAFHFIGHGGHDPSRGGFLMVQEEDGAEADLLYADTLTGILSLPGGQGPKLVVLNSCEGAVELSSDDLFSSTAAELLQGGIPAVVAMQFAIRDRFAQNFSRRFYSYLTAGIPVERAVAITRNALQPKWAEWMAPVVYVRTSDTALF